MLQVQKIKGPGGSVGCYSCLTVGVHDGRRMTYPAHPPFPPRLGAMYSHPELIHTLLGYNGVPSLAELRVIGFDPIIDFPHDAMHMIALNFWKTSISIMFTQVMGREREEKERL
jgi:hypothetical protein